MDRFPLSYRDVATTAAIEGYTSICRESWSNWTCEEIYSFSFQPERGIYRIVFCFVRNEPDAIGFSRTIVFQNALDQRNGHSFEMQTHGCH